jgi:trk system potassium uptake protein TrkH
VLVAVALLAIALDVGFAHSLTGFAAALAMLVLALVVGRRAVVVARSALGTAGVRGLLGFEVALATALVGFTLARVMVALAATTGSDIAAAGRTYDFVFVVLWTAAWTLVVSPTRTARWLMRLSQRPALLLSGSFAGMIAVGSLLLTLPLSLRSVRDVSFVDSLFTITSAVCVTGLTVNDVLATYSVFGQLVILLAIQLGGVGIMTIAALALTFSRRGSLRSQLQYAAMMDATTLEDLRTMVRSIIVGTLVVEAVGAALLWKAFEGHAALEGRSAGFLAVFHAVSAFCNAGFALFPGNLTPFVGDASVQVVIMALVLLGGIGFPVMLELMRLAWRWSMRLFRRGSRHPGHLSLAASVVLRTTAFLLLLGALVTWAFEATGALAHLGFVDQGIAAVFASVNTRTSGFNTVDLGAMREGTLLVYCALMFIGGSPLSTAGGIKTTTAAVLVATLRAELLRREAELGRREVAVDALRKAIAVTALSGAIVLVVVLLLTFTEDLPFLPLAFEAVSAFATVGLSTGITGSLSAVGKLVITVTMFVGRVGPLTIALAVGQDAKPRPYRLAPESLPVG